MTKITKKFIQEILQNIYDPEFSLIDIYTMGLIYKIILNNSHKTLKILMTLTSPICPMADFILANVRNQLETQLSGYTINVELIFDPPWSPDKIIDKDLQGMFGNFNVF